MNDSGKFIFMLVIAIVGIGIGLSFFGGSFSGALAGGSQDLLASVSLVASRPQDAGKFLVSFDNLTNIYPVRVGSLKDTVTVLDVDVLSYTNPDTIYVSTNKGVYLSTNAGLTFNPVEFPNGEVSADSWVFKLIEGPARGSYFISVYRNGRGYVYATQDSFVHVTPLADFKNEAAYDLLYTDGYVYMGMSNGQLLRYDTGHQTLSVVTVFAAPVYRFYQASDGYLYTQLKSGDVFRSAGPQGPFYSLRLPGGFFFFGSGKVQTFSYDRAGNVYILTSQGLFVSKDSGYSFSFIRDIPLLTEKIDSFGVEGHTIYLVSGKRLYTSADGGKEWKISDLPNDFGIREMFFLGNGRVVLSS